MSEHRTGVDPATGPATGPVIGPESGPRPAAPVPTRSRAADKDARAAILARTREALRDNPPVPAVRRTYRRERTEGVDVVGLFAERAAEYRATVLRSRPDGLLDDTADLLDARGVRRAVVAAGPRLHWLTRLGVELVLDEPPLTVDQLEEADGVITGCALAIAETGTVVLDGGEDCGRRVLTLVPDYHLCVVRPDQIVATVPEAVARLDPRAPLTWISGPSATSDIELSRVEGVHGPRTLDVLVLG